MELEADKHQKPKRDLEFTLIPHSDLGRILKILEKRLPMSANVYNSALRLSRVPGEFPMYTLNALGLDDSWILAVHSDTDDTGTARGLVISQMISISAPSNPHITDGIKQAFIDTTAINWERSYLFNSVDRALSAMIIEISAFVKKNATTCYPNYYYTISREDALNFEVLEENSVEIKSLNTDTELDRASAATFVTTGWSLAQANTTEYAAGRIKALPSCGVYVEGRLVSAVLTHSDLHVGMLTTDPIHRGKGYGLLCLKAHLKNLAAEGYVPSSCVYQTNMASNKVHLKCGMSVSHECDYIKHV